MTTKKMTSAKRKPARKPPAQTKSPHVKSTSTKLTPEELAKLAKVDPVPLNPELQELLAVFTEFDSDFDPEDSQEHLWQLFHFASISQEGCDQSQLDVQTRFFFYDRLKATLPAIHRLCDLINKVIPIQ